MSGAGESRGGGSIAGTALRILPLQIIFRAGEGLLPFFLAAWFGSNHSTDVYYFAWAVFAFAGSLVFSAHQDSALVPVLAEERLERPAEVPRLVGSVLAHTWIFGGILAALVAAGALVWFRIRYDGPDFALAGTMVVPFAVYLVILSTRTFFSTLLVSARHFAPQPIASAFGMMTTLAILFLLNERVGVLLIPLASVAGEIVATTTLAWVALRIARLSITLNLSRPPALLKIVRLIAADVGGAAITRINPVIDQLMAGLVGIAGAGTVLKYSGEVALAPTSLLQAALLPVLLSHLSDRFAAREFVIARTTVLKTLTIVCSLLLVISIVLFAIRGPLLRFAFLRGSMTPEGVELMISIFPYHLVGLAPFGALLVLARAHIAAKNTSLFLAVGIINALCNALFNVILLRLIGLPGLALATSAVQAVVAVVLWRKLEQRLRELGA